MSPAPVFTVTPAMAFRTPPPLRVNVPPLIVSVLVDESVLVRMRLPVLCRVVLPAGAGVLDRVSATLPVTPPASVVVLATRTSGALDCVTVPVNVIGLPAKATGVLLLFRATALAIVNGAFACSTPAVSVKVPVPRALAEAGINVPSPVAAPAFNAVPPEWLLIGFVRLSVPTPAAVSERAPPLSKIVPASVVPPVSLAVAVELPRSVVVPVKGRALGPPTGAWATSRTSVERQHGACASSVTGGQTV